MFSFLSKTFLKRKREPVVCPRQEHCISRRNIDPDALKVLYRLSNLGYTAYLVGGGVRDLLMGREPKDFDVGTSARPNEVKRAFHSCYLVGRRFRLAHVRFGEKVIETATFRRNAQSVGDIIEHASEGPLEDNCWGTPETDAFRRDFTVNGLFYDIRTFAVIDWVGGLDDLRRKLIRSIGDPMIRFREDPVRMMRAIRFSCKLGFSIEKGTDKAMRKLHECITSASVPRLCEEVLRLFTCRASCKAFRMMWEYGLLGDLVPELGAFIDMDGGAESETWRFLAALDDYEKTAGELDNAVRVAVLLYALSRTAGARTAADSMARSLKIPRVLYFTSVALMESAKRISASTPHARRRWAFSRNAADILAFNRIVARAQGQSEAVLDEIEKCAAEGAAAGSVPAAPPPRRRRSRRRSHRTGISNTNGETQEAAPEYEQGTQQ